MEKFGALAVANRSAIAAGLEKLNEELDRCYMTTHGSLGPHDINDVAEQLVKTWEDPSAYNVSELSQRINNLTRQRIANTKGNNHA